jgi:hypothetical protein
MLTFDLYANVSLKGNFYDYQRQISFISGFSFPVISTANQHYREGYPKTKHLNFSYKNDKTTTNKNATKVVGLPYALLPLAYGPTFNTYISFFNTTLLEVNHSEIL